METKDFAIGFAAGKAQGGGGGDEPSGTVEIKSNGTHNVKKYAYASVNVPSKEPNLQAKTATENGMVLPDSGYDGLSQVTVNMPSADGEGF